MSRPRILVLGEYVPGGRASGSQLRMDTTLDGLALVGDVDYLRFAAAPWRSRGGVQRDPNPARVGLSSSTTITRHIVPDALSSAYPWLWLVHSYGRGIGHTLPIQLARRRTPPRELVQRVLRALPPADLIWCFKAGPALAFRELLAQRHAPLVVDLDDLLAIGSTSPEEAEGRGPRLRSMLYARDRAARARWQGRIVELADRVALCNPREAEELGAPGVAVIPNGSAVPPRRPERPVGSRPVLLFVGLMRYFPNADGARHLVEDVAPLLRQLVGSFEIRIVGSAPPEVTALGNGSDVVVTGYVDRLDEELARADLVVVPLRHGTGTRLKILEAFAHQVPVVSTTLGADGLGVEDGVHLLIADDAPTFAQACQRLVVDPLLRRSLTDAAYELVAASYDWPVIHQQIAALAQATIDRAREPRHGAVAHPGDP